MSSGKRRKNCFYNRRRYWYHVSTTLKKKYEYITPWDSSKAFNRSDDEPEGKRICVAPTIEQCITAIPYMLGTIVTIYKTKTPILANPPEGIFDAKVTEEGWIQRSATFKKIGILKLEDIEESLGINKCIIPETASSGIVKESRKALNWWRKARIKRFIKKA
jgi:hypothetical protein